MWNSEEGVDDFIYLFIYLSWLLPFFGSQFFFFPSSFCIHIFTTWKQDVFYILKKYYMEKKGTVKLWYPKSVFLMTKDCLFF